ncbi:MAG: hypothetical protein Q4G58_04875 [bacterium]|nr:hypothetical protein [bacterium]
MDSNKEKEFSLEDALLEEAKLAEEEVNKELMSENLEQLAALDEILDISEGESIEESFAQHFEESVKSEEPTEEVPPIMGLEDDSDGISIEELDQIINSDAATTDNDVFSLEEFDSLLGDTVKEDVIQAPKNASDIFSDSLGAVSSLDDAALEQQFNDLLPDENLITETNKKKTLVEKMFANIEPENPQEEIAKEEQRIAEKEQKKKQKEEAKEMQKEEKKKAAAEKKAAKAAAKDAKAKQKAELKAQKQKEKEELAKTYVPEGKINKVGASIVFTSAAVLGIVVIGGTYKGAYKILTSNANFDSQIGRYEVAYEELSGINLKASDQELYDKLQTIMLMNKHQNSYENFRELNMNVEALDSLLKGLERYDEYYSQAKEHGVAANYDSMKKQMIAELKQAFDLSESDARKLIDEKDQETYTKSLMQICSSIKQDSPTDGTLASVNE